MDLISRKYWCELANVIVEGVVVVVVPVPHLQEGLVDLHHLILQGPVRVSEVPAGMLHLFLGIYFNTQHIIEVTSTVLVSMVILNVV